MLLLHPSIGCLSERDKAVCLRDFAQGRAHLVFVFQVKLSMWRQLPWILCGVAHPEKGVAAECGRRALALYQAAAPGAEHHSLTASMCIPGTIGHTQLLLYITDRHELQELPFLCVAVAKLRFIPITERWVESLHSLLKRYLALAPHASALHFAFHGVQQPLRLAIRQDPELLARLAQWCGTCRNPVLCLEQTGLYHHPGVAALQARVGRGSMNRKCAPDIVRILYHVDT